MSRVTKIIHSLDSPLTNHSIPGKYLCFFEKDKDNFQTVKTHPKKKSRKIQNLDFLIPRIRSALDFASHDQNLSKIFRGIVFPKITADSQKLILYYALGKSGSISKEKVLEISSGLLYKYLTRKVPSKIFPSRLDFRKYSFNDEKLDLIYQQIESELSK